MSTATQTRASVAVWFEIPSTDLERALHFYETIFAIPLQRMDFGAEKMGVFPYERPGISGCVTDNPNLKPGDSGTAVFLNCDGQLDVVLARVDAAGGGIVEDKTKLPQGLGYAARIRDSEGNHIGLHSAY